MALGASSYGAGADEVVEKLFTHRPRTESDLRARLCETPPVDARRALVTRLGRAGAAPSEVATYVRALDILGLSAAELPSLTAILLDTEAPIAGRAVALALTSALDPNHAQAMARCVSAQDLLAMSNAQLTAVIAGMPSTPARAAEITDKLVRQPANTRARRLAQIDRMRTTLGVPAAFLYRDALGRDDLGLGDALVAPIVEEGGVGAAMRIEALWQEAKNEAHRSRWAEVLSRVYRAPGRPPAAGLVARAYASHSDANAGRRAVLSVTSPVDGSLTLARVRCDGSGAIVEGAMTSLSDTQELEEWLLMGPEPLPREPLPAAEVGAWVEEAARKTSAEAALDPILHAAVCYFAMAARL
jgi:hypothetical protein